MVVGFTTILFTTFSSHNKITLKKTLTKMFRLLFFSRVVICNMIG